jgi:NTP pyrophosphatase (non-canonical NTP hydrolase)
VTPDVSDIHGLLVDYLDARGIEMPSGRSARKVAEEAVELVEVCGKETPELDQVAHELADVVLAAAVVAAHYGVTIEDAITAKIVFDSDRDRATPTKRSERTKPNPIQTAGTVSDLISDQRR